MNKNTKIYLDNDARKKILRGVNAVCEPVRRTYGPGGGNYLTYGLYSRPYRISNDGVLCAELIELKDEAENLVAKAVQDAAKRTNLLAGDGTTATCVLVQKIINTIIPEISQIGETADFEKALVKKTKKRGVMDIKRELIKTKNEVVEKLKKLSKKIKTKEDLEKIAIVSVENEEYGKIIADMSWKVGLGGYIDILEGFKGEIETEVIEGARFPAKIPAKIFVNKLERYEMEVIDSPVLLTNYVIDKGTMGVFLNKLQQLHKLIIIAPDFKEDALIAMAQINKKNNALIYAPVKAPSLKTVQFEDVEVFTGARFINKDRGDKPDTITNEDLGFLTKLVVKDADVREDCVALGGRGGQHRTISISKGKSFKKEEESFVEKRIKILKEQLEETRESGQKEVLRRRIAGLSSAVGIIRVSADSEAETYYWKKKIEDAVYACRSALEEGYVQGGGLALKEIANKLPKNNLLYSALLASYEQIQENAEGVEIGGDIIDPTKAIRCVVEHAVSVAANLATIKSIIVEEADRAPAEGYGEIAKAIKMFNLLWAKERGIKIENEEEIAKDTMARHDEILRRTID